MTSNGADPIVDRRRPADRATLGPAVAAAALVAVVAALIGLPARATYGARTSADEPQYLLTATSLAADGDLDIADEIATAAYLDYHEVPIDRQAARRSDGGRISPHDPLLPLLLAAPMAIGGWAAAKTALALVAGATAGLTVWAAVRRLDVAVVPAATVTALAFAGMPLAAYGTQVYPELPAALALTTAAAAVTSPSLGHRHPPTVVALAAVIALPWLAVKYVPVAGVAGIALLVRLRSRPRAVVAVAAVTALAGVTYLLGHQALYGGWTVYASGDHFTESGQFAVIGTDVDLVGRSRRLTGLLVDGAFGLAVWAPLWFLLPVAVGRAATRLGRAQPGALPLRLGLAVLVTTWLTASFVALTMHGWWVPGRQLVVGLPMGVLLVAAWVDHSSRRLRAAVGLGLVGLVNWVWLAVEASTGRRTLIVDFVETSAPGFRALSPILPDGIRAEPIDTVLLGIWSLVVVAGVVAGFRDGTEGPAVDPRADLGGDPQPSVMVRR